MFGYTFHHDTIRKYVILFGTLFNDIYVRREDNSGNEEQILKIPVSYAPRDKILARLDSNPDLGREVAITLPRISFEMTSMNYDSERKLNTIRKNVKGSATSNTAVDTVYNPVPYTFNFSLFIYVKNAEDGTKILEQILPFFTPDWTATVNVLPAMNLAYDIPTVLQNVSVEDTYEGDFETRRAMIYTLDFVMKGYVFGPVTQSGVINIANTNFFIDERTGTSGTANLSVESITVRPGLDANSNPTTNSSVTVAVGNIKPTDDYGIISIANTVDPT
jgi:hypothetical protein